MYAYTMYMQYAYNMHVKGIHSMDVIYNYIKYAYNIGFIHGL